MALTLSQRHASTITLPEIPISSSSKEEWSNLLTLTTPAADADTDTDAVAIFETTTTTNANTAANIPRRPSRAHSLSRKLNQPPQPQPRHQPELEQHNLRTEVINISTANPSHLFWVPASQHPEIAPAEFEKYVQQHGLTIRQRSMRNKRHSILSTSFTPNDVTEDEDRKEAADGDQEEAQMNNRGRKRTSMLRRSMSMQLPTASSARTGKEWAVPDFLIFDRNSSPLDDSRILVPKGINRPLTRRGARSKFNRRNSSSSSSSTRDNAADEGGQPMLRSSSAEGFTLTDEPITPQPFMASLQEEEEEQEDEEVKNIEQDDAEIRSLGIASRAETSCSLTLPPSPPTSIKQTAPSPPEPLVITRSVSTMNTTTKTSHSRHSHKGGWSWLNLFSDNQHSTNHTQQPSDTTSGKFTKLSTLFSRKSKSSHRHTINNSQSKELAMSATTNLLLHNEKKKDDFQLRNPMLQTQRLPLHVERAIYKLSHIKLANPRRPLHEQVLISNQMFWYLSIVAAASNNSSSNQNDSATESATATNLNNNGFTTTSAANSNERQKMAMEAIRKRKTKPKKRLVKKNSSNQLLQQQKKSKSIALLNSTPNQSHPNTPATGFVIPNNYLNPPNKLTTTTVDDGANSSKKTRTKRTQKVYVQSSDSDGSSSSHSDSLSSSSSSEEEEDRDHEARRFRMTHTSADSRRKKASIKKINEEDDNIPLAAYSPSNSNYHMK